MIRLWEQTFRRTCHDLKVHDASYSRSQEGGTHTRNVYERTWKKNKTGRTHTEWRTQTLNLHGIPVTEGKSRRPVPPLTKQFKQQQQKKKRVSLRCSSSRADLN